MFPPPHQRRHSQAPTPTVLGAVDQGPQKRPHTHSVPPAARLLAQLRRAPRAAHGGSGRPFPLLRPTGRTGRICGAEESSALLMQRALSRALSCPAAARVPSAASRTCSRWGRH